MGNSGTINGNVNLAGTNKAGQGLTINGTVKQNATFAPTVNLSQVSTFFQNANQNWGGLSQTAKTSTSFGQLTVTGLQAGQNIVNLSLASESALNGITLTGPQNAFVIFNITGTGGSSSQALKALTLSLSGGLSSNDILFNILDV